MTYHPNPIPLHTLFSAWVFSWAVAYIIIRKTFPQINTKWCDPTFALLFTLSYQLYLFICILFRINSISTFLKVLAKFVIITTVFKLVPLYFVWDHTVNWTNSIISFAVLFSIYIAYITYLGIDVFEIYDDVTESIIKDDGRLRFLPFNTLHI